MVGASGAGKSTWATEFISKNPGWVRVNRDDIRRQILGKITPDYYSDKKFASTEKHITNLQDDQIRYWLHQGMNVIVDNNHLKKQYLDHYLSEFNWMADIQFKIMDLDLSTCQQRIQKREGKDTPVLYIKKQQEEMDKLYKSYPEYFASEFLCTGKYTPLHHTAPTKKCIIVDIDGTIASCEGLRNPYDYDKVHLDKPIEPVTELVKTMKGNWLKRLFNPISVVYLSGRESACRAQTEAWIKAQKLPWDGHLFMRQAGDKRMDKLVKRELYYKHVHPSFKTLFVLDDRLQVCHMWYQQGLFVLNANQGLKHF